VILRHGELATPTPRRAGLYVVSAGRTDGLPEVAAALWSFFHTARDLPLELRLEPLEKSSAPWLGELGTLEPLEPRAESALCVFTSGTTGTPRPHLHRLAALLHPARRVDGGRWMLSYAPHRWPGVSVLLHALRCGGSVVVPASLEPRDWLVACEESGVTHVSLTPSWLRRLLLSLGRGPLERLELLQLLQVTFGGESATPSVLDLARSLWPRARVTHIYAATELGDVLTVSDGRAGVPHAKLERPGLRIDETGELWVGDRRSGDLWILDGDRYDFRGRVQDAFKVRGNLVFPLVVEEAALAVEGVREARAHPVASSLLGHVVGRLPCVRSLGESR
jgi:acyl-CoA synthetase (AMP-forming)/AMP-acid ligase II